MTGGEVDSPSRTAPLPAASAFAQVIESGRQEILEQYAAGLESASAIIANDELSRRQVITHGDEILTDVVTSLRSGRTVIDDTYRLTSYESGVTRAARGMHPRESMGTASAFFSTTVDWVVPRLPEGPVGVALLSSITTTLNVSLTRRFGEGVSTYSGYLMGKINDAHVEERRRIARELHDRVGSELSVAHRQLECARQDAEGLGEKTLRQLAQAHQSALQALENLRAVTSDLRLHEPLRSLEQAMRRFVESTPAGADCRLSVNGDEAWAPPTTRDEVFLIVREALRNALRHSGAGLIVAQIDISPDELRAVVMDNGCGFDPQAPTTSDGAGLATMRERAELMGGWISQSSSRGASTRIELVVPLPGRRDDDAR